MSSLAHRVTRREVHQKAEEEGRAMSWVRGWVNCNGFEVRVGGL